MPAANVTFVTRDLPAFSPRISATRIGMVGPATKGAVDQRVAITDIGTFAKTYGKPRDGMYAPRAALRYAREGSNLTYTRVAGSNLAPAFVALPSDTGIAILNIVAASAGTWANTDLEVAVSHNGPASAPTSYNLLVYEEGSLVESYLLQTNSSIATAVNTKSTRIIVGVVSGVGSTFPAATVVNGVQTRLGLAGGNDGAFATSDSVDSSTGGIAGKEFYGLTHSGAGSRVFETVSTVPAAAAGATTLRGSLGFPILPNSFVLKVTVSGPATLEFSDNGNNTFTGGKTHSGVGILTPSAGAHVAYIDYLTGDYAILLVGGATFVSGNAIDVIAIRGRTETVGTTTSDYEGTAAEAAADIAATGVSGGVEDYSGFLSEYPLAPGHFSNTRCNFYVRMLEIVCTSAAAAATQASSVANTRSLGGYIKPNSVQLHLDPDGASPVVLYDDGLGRWRDQADGAGNLVTGSINYRTGAWTISTTGGTAYASALTGGEKIVALYSALINNMGGAVPTASGAVTRGLPIQDGTTTGGAALTDASAGGAALTGPIQPGTLKISAELTTFGLVTIYDDGAGGWSWYPREQADAGTIIDDGAGGTVSLAGAVNYVTGTWSITLTGDTWDSASTPLTADYTNTPANAEVRALGGPANGTVGPTATQVAGARRWKYDLPASGNSFLGSNFVNQLNGAFLLGLDLSDATYATSLHHAQPIDVVYATATILGRGDATTTEFSGTVQNAPFRREANRLVAYQADAEEAGGSGQAQAAFFTLGATSADDYWSQNVSGGAAANPMNAGTGVTTIKWTAAPALDEAVFVLGEEVVAHVTSRYCGDIGNERDTITDGLYCALDADPNNAGKLRFRVFFNPGSGSVVVESYDNLDDKDDLADTVNATSELVLIELTTAATAADVDATQNVGMAGAFTTSDVIGTISGNVRTGMQLYRNPDEVGIDFLAAPGQWHRQVIIEGLNIAEERGCFFMASLPLVTDVQDATDFTNGAFNSTVSGVGPPIPTAAVPYPPLATINSADVVWFYSWVDYTDGFTNVSVTEPPEGDVFALTADIGRTFNPWVAFAGPIRGLRNEIESLVHSPSQAEMDQMQGLYNGVVQVVNPFVTKIGVGTYLNGQRTSLRDDTSPRNRIANQWTVHLIQEAWRNGAGQFQFDTIDDILFRRLTRFVESILAPMTAQPRPALRSTHVLFDDTTTTAADRDNNIARGKVWVQFFGFAESIELELITVPNSAEFGDVAVVGA